MLSPVRLAAFLILAVPALAQNSVTPPSAGTAPGTTNTTQGFITSAAMSDLYEVTAGRLASTRSKSANVRDFGAQMVTSHTQSTQQLQSVLAKAGIKATPPTTLDKPDQALMDQLQNASDADFDSLYLKQQDAAHRQVQILMQEYSTTGQSPALRKFAAQMLPVISKHIAMLEQIKPH